MKVIDGKAISALVRAEVAKEALALRKRGIVPGLAVVLVGDDPASQVYVRNKHLACEEAHLVSFQHRLPAEASESELLALIAQLNADEAVNGILVQLPLPPHICEEKVIAAISPDKDVDAFHPENVGHIMVGDYRFLPCTPAGIMELLHREGVSVEGKECVVLGRSNIVGKPMAMLLLHESGTVTVCHSRTKNLAEICRRADILVVAVGRARFVTADMVKEDAVVIDVGINREISGKLCGDVDFEGVASKCSFITPVPGGVGPMTIAMLLRNTITAAKHQKSFTTMPL